MSLPRSAFDKPRGKPNSLARKGKFRLAAACAELMDDDEVAWWLREVMAGRDPDAKRDAEGNPIVSVGGFSSAPEWKDRLKAAEMFLNRRNGQAPQSVLVEQELHVRGKVTHALTPVQIAQMEPGEKAVLRAILTKAKTGASAGDHLPDRFERVPAGSVLVAGSAEVDSAEAQK